MRPTRPLLTLAALLLLAPLAASAGKGPPPPPADTFPDGDYFFVDQLSFDKIKSHAAIDQQFDEFCLAGLMVHLDPTTTLNHRVEFQFTSLGTIAKQSDDKVQGIFTSVDLRVTVFDGPENINNQLFSSTVMGAPCELEGRMTKVGLDDDDNVVGRLKATLECELGPNLSAMGVIADPELSSIHEALLKRKNVKIDIETGDFRLKNNGIRNDPGESGLDFTAVPCFTSSDD
jgi:hypothetical protein